MKLAVPIVAAIVLGSACAEARESISISKDFQLGGAKAVEVHFPAGDLTITAGDGDVVAVTMTAHCRFGGDCAERARRIRLVSDVRGEKLVFKLEGMAKLNVRGLAVDLRMTVPRQLPLQVEMGAGDLEVRGLENDVSIELGAGDAKVRLPEDAVRTVDLDVGVGDLSLHRHGDRLDGSGFISRSLRWRDGTGHARVNVDLGVGDIDVALD